jgi:hypothetical protein
MRMSVCVCVCVIILCMKRKDSISSNKLETFNPQSCSRLDPRGTFDDVWRLMIDG